MREVITQILQDAKALSDLDIKRAEVGLRPAGRGTKILGTIHSDDTRRLWAVGHWYVGQAAHAMMAAAFEATSKEEADDLNIKGARLQQLGTLAVEMFWMEARNDIGGTAWKKSLDIGIRQGWLLVSQKAKTDNPLAHLLGHIQVEEEE